MNTQLVTKAGQPDRECRHLPLGIRPGDLLVRSFALYKKKATLSKTRRLSCKEFRNRAGVHHDQTMPSSNQRSRPRCAS